MILNTLTPKNLALFGILHTYDNYTINKDNLLVTASVEIAYNLGDIQTKIDSITTKVENLEDMEGISDETKDYILQDYNEILETLRFLKDKLS
jgi:Mg2+ and Co2+ transporter CorA|tara:strand:- start:2404 stop:2682 length:279 start_codon:yes stop_codon:yes gene_type:complete